MERVITAEVIGAYIAYLRDEGKSQAMLIIQTFASSVISTGRPGRSSSGNLIQI